uniref:Pyruvate dehydrogenase (Acetyl-transferring) kinase, mitochondrial n=1 Tax=Tanacetum cinerariifolium TaxID=118510 RepID=A0A6L2LGF8_TANCI|nr:pyruvate dehydrogenase (acetyl-transferring) kinase, mitochondrial [Tanacetum cinerariifolium]
MSLTGAASRWLRNKPFGLITTWEYLKIKFLSKYFPPARTAKKIKEINNFQQESDENLYQDWERFKELLMTCPQHYLTEMQEVVLFYNGLDVPTRQILDLRAIQAQLNNLGREIKKVNEKVYVAQVGCEQCKGPHYTKDFPLKEEGKTLRESYYTQFGAPFQGGGYRETALGFYQRNNANPSYQEQRKSMEDTLSKFMSESEKRYEENSNLIKEIQTLTDAAIRNQGASIKTLEIQIGRMIKKKDSESFTLPCFINNVCFDNALDDLGASVSVMPLLTYLNLGLGYQNALILGRTLLSIARAKIYVFKRNITLRVEKEKIIFKSVKPASSLIKRVYMLGWRERMELDLEARLMGETLALNRSLDPFFDDYIELSYLNIPLELRRNQVDDLMPTIEEGEVFKEFRVRNDSRIFGHLSNYDHDKKIRIDCGYNLKFSCMIGMITIQNGNEEVTYQMVRSHLKFKHHTNEQCNKIPPLLKDLAAKKSTKLVKYRSSEILYHKDANEHMEKVLEIVDLFYIPNITQYQVMLKAFPMSLTGSTSCWLRNKPSGSITIWEDLILKCLSNYCPPALTAKKIEEINNFQQEPDETLYQAWERFKELLMKCLQHYLTKMQEVILFYNGMDVQTRQILDSKDAIPSKTVADAKAARVEYEQCKGPYYTEYFPLKEEGKTLKEVYYTEFGGPYQIKTRYAVLDHLNTTQQNRKFMFKLRQTTIPFPSRLSDYYCEENKGSYGPQFSKAYSYEASHIDNSIPRKEKDPGSFTLPCYIYNVCFDNALADLGASEVDRYGNANSDPNHTSPSVLDKRTRQSSQARPPTDDAGTSTRVRRPPATGRITSAGRSNRLPPVVAFVNTEGCTSGHCAGVVIGDTTEPIREVITSDMTEVRDWYLGLFRGLRSFPEIKDINDEKELTKMIKMIKVRHNNIVPAMALGVQQLRKSLDPKLDYEYFDEVQVEIFEGMTTSELDIWDNGTHENDTTPDAFDEYLQMMRTVRENLASWSDKLDDALWAFRTAFKTPTGCTPYKLAYENSLIYKERTKKLHDSKIKNRIFNVGDQVLLFNSRLKIFSGKLKTRWSGPFTITQEQRRMNDRVSQNNEEMVNLHHQNVKQKVGENKVSEGVRGSIPEMEHGLPRGKDHMKLQNLKKEIRAWIAIYNRKQKGHIEEIKSKLKNIDQMVDQGGGGEGGGGGGGGEGGGGGGGEGGGGGGEGQPPPS